MVENLFQVSPEDEAEAHIEKSLRPQRFEEFIGQGRVVENLKLAIDAAKARRDVLDHVLLSGMPGLGKTTLATLIKEALSLDPQGEDQPRLLFFLGQTYVSWGRHEMGMETMQVIVREHPRSPIARKAQETLVILGRQ